MELTYGELFAGVSGFGRFGETVRELADGPRYRMIGNGVVAPVAEWIARGVRRALDA